MRISFELKKPVNNISEAKEFAYDAVADFMEISDAAAPAIVDLELKVSLAEEVDGIVPKGKYLVTGYAHLKNGMLKPGQS